MPVLTSSLVVRLIDQVTAPAKKVGKALLGLNDTATKGRLTAAIDRNNQALDRARIGLADAAVGYYTLKNAIGAPVKAAMDFESAMADVRKVVDFPTPKAFEDFQQSLVDLSKRVPLSLNGLAQIAAAAGQAGIAGEDLIRFTEAAAKVGTAFDITADAAGDSMAKLMTGLGLTIDQTVLLTDSMNHLSNVQASSASDILDVVRRVGAQAKMFGFSAEQVAAFGSAMLSAGAESDVAATSFRNMGNALTRGESATKAQNKAFKRLGLDATKVAKKMQKDAVGTTVEVLEKLAALPAELRASVSSDLFGNEARALGPLLTNLDLVRKSLGLVDNEAKYAGSSFREFEVRAKTFSNAVQVFDNRITALKIAIGAALIPVLNRLMETITPAIERFSDLVNQYPDLTGKVAAAVAGLVAFRIAVASLKFVGLLGRGGALSLLSAGITAIGPAARGAAAVARGALTGIAGYFGTLALRARLATAATGAAPGVFARLGDAAIVAGRGVLALLNPLKLVRGAAILLRGALMFTGVGAVLAGIAAAGTLIYNNWEGLTSFFQGVGEGFMNALGPVTPLLEPIAKFAGDIFSSISGLLGPLQTTNAEWKSWGETVGGVVGNAVRSIVEAIRDLVGLLGRAYQKAVDVGNALKNAFTWGGGGGGEMPAVDPNGNVTGHRANGGKVWPGGSFIVGDGGEEEIFTPKTGGTITPMSKAGGFAIEQIGPFNITSTDPLAAGREVRKQVEEALLSLMRGAHSDMPAR